MTAAVLFGMLILMWLNYAPISPSAYEKSTFPINDVRGSAIVHKGLSYTLNFDQQKILVDFVLKAVQVKKSDYTPTKLNFDKFIIYRFKDREVEILPITYNENNLVFSVPSLNSETYYMELSGGQLKTMIPSSFDP